MLYKSPQFWGSSCSLLGYILEPLSWLYRAGAALHEKTARPYRAPVPVISVGNLVLGGAGKTPVTIAIARDLQALGFTPHILSRGYGGSLSGPVQVDLACHSFQQVGDEPLLLARTAPTWVAKNRQAVVMPAVKAGADILVLDDGHQNHALEKDVRFVVVNGAQGFGNGRVFPAGPLRQSIRSGLKTASALVFIAEKEDEVPTEIQSVSCPVIRARISPIAPQSRPVVAFAGLGHPEKFCQTLEKAGYQIRAFYPFPDHHPYTQEDMENLKKRAATENAPLITTEKDAARLPLHQREEILTLPIALDFQPPHALKAFLRKALKSKGIRLP